MNVMTPAPVLRVSEKSISGSDLGAVIGHDIRTSPERIARYCVTTHEPIYEDLAALVESMAYFDRLAPRHRSNGWIRELTIEIPVYELAAFQRPALLEALVEAAWFLTGDQWSFNFIRRKGAAPVRQRTLPISQTATKHVIPFSDGLDSFAQAQFSVREHGRDGVMLVRSGLGRDHIFRDLGSLRVPRKFKGARLRETSYRTRPLVFYSIAAIAASVLNADAVVIGENGQGSFGPACLPFADEWWFRSAHPAFVPRWANVLRLILGVPTRFEQPQLWLTKGEVLAKLRDHDLIDGWQQTSSCSTRPNQRHGHAACGICGGCLLRAVSARAAGLTPSSSDNAFDIFAVEDETHDRSGKKRTMTSGERAVAVRAIAAMAEFAGLAESKQGAAVIRREARLVDDVNPAPAEAAFARLLRRHRAEWHAAMDSLPAGSWVREIADQL